MQSSEVPDFRRMRIEISWSVFPSGSIFPLTSEGFISGVTAELSFMECLLYTYLTYSSECPLLFDIIIAPCFMEKN